MSRRKQPRASNALAEALAEQWRDRLSKDRAEMANAPRQYGATQTVTPPAPAWRSMASAPRDGSQIIVRIDRLNWFCRFQDGHWWIDEDFGHCNENEIAAWTPIPEWTGEVAE